MIIATNESLTYECEMASKCEFVAFDTEFIRKTEHFYPTPALLQFCYDGENAVLCDLIDESIDWTPLKKLLLNDDLVKIFHSAKQDIEVIKFLFDITPHNIFDTQVAAMFLGYDEQVGYEKLVKNFLDIKMDKSCQFTDWLARPLTAAQLQYAVLDVQYLHKLFMLLKEKMTPQHYKWAFLASAESHVITKKHFTEKFVAKSLHHRHTPTTQEIFIYSQIVDCREEEVTMFNKRRGSIIDDIRIDNLVAMIINESSIEEIINKTKIEKEFLAKIISKLKSQKDINEVEKIISDTMKRRNISINKPPIYYMIKTFFHILCGKYNINKQLVATHDDMIDIVVFNEMDKFMKTWRYDLFGKPLQQLFNGEISLSVDKDGNVIVN